MKQNPLIIKGAYHVQALTGDILYASYRSKGKRLVGIFSLKGSRGPVAVEAPDGIYANLAGAGSVEVKFSRISCQGEPIVFEVSHP